MDPNEFQGFMDDWNDPSQLPGRSTSVSES